jgi:hypothetical protein
MYIWQDDYSGEEHSDSDSDVPDELKQDYIDELTGETHSRYVDVISLFKFLRDLLNFFIHFFAILLTHKVVGFPYQMTACVCNNAQRGMHRVALDVYLYQ